MAKVTKRLAFAIIEHLRAEIESGIENADSLEVAAECLAEAYQVDIDNEEQRQQFSLLPITLNQAFLVGVSKMQEEVAKEIGMLPKETSIPDMESGSKDDPGFFAYILELEKNGHFRGAVKGSAAIDGHIGRARSRYYTEDESLGPRSTAEKIIESTKYKTLGNEEFKKGNHEAAISLYTKAIEACPRDSSMALCNRAAARMSTKDYESAIIDTTRAIEIDPDYAKAYSRRGNAYRALGMNEKALEEGYKLAIKYDPSNSVSIHAISELEGTASSSDESGGTANPISDMMNQFTNDPAFRENIMDTVKNLDPEQLSSMLASKELPDIINAVKSSMPMFQSGDKGKP